MHHYSNTTRFFAVILMLGGVVGVICAVFFGIQFFQQHSLLALPMVGLGALFVWAVFIGYRLWQGTPFGRKWATILFASQIPVLVLPGITFQWFTGAQLRLVFLFGDHANDLIFVGTFGANGEFYVGNFTTEFMVGINFFAVIALLLLRRFNKKVKHQVQESA